MVDLFNITREEISTLSGKTIESLIKSNRDLKLNYQSVRAAVQDSKKLMEDARDNFSKELSLKGSDQLDLKDFDNRVDDLFLNDCLRKISEIKQNGNQAHAI